MALELRPAHDPAKKYGFVGVVISVEDLSASIWLWRERDGAWAADKVVSIPAEPAPTQPGQPLAGGADGRGHRDGKRVYFTNSLYHVPDEQLYPDGVGGWMTKLDVADGGGIGFGQRFFLAAVKAHYDPVNRFRFNHNIRPAQTG
jgi:56kDa selenium binding protein (SBP56)/Berberine and berberine like